MQLQQYLRCMDHEILFWMKADQDYLAGLALFERYTHNTKIGRMLRIGGATLKNRLTLLYELSKIAEHIAAFENASALVKPPVKLETPKSEQPMPPEVTTVDKLRSEQKICYKMLDNLHAVLPYREIQERKEIAFRILDIDDQLKAITERITHYETNGVIPPAPVNDEPKKVSEMGEAELIIRQNKDLPIPNNVSNTCAIIGKVDQILSLNHSDPSANTSSFEDEIDQMVYELYGLTEEEIMAVEQEVTK